MAGLHHSPGRGGGGEWQAYIKVQGGDKGGGGEWQAYITVQRRDKGGAGEWQAYITVHGGVEEESGRLTLQSREGARVEDKP